MAHYDRGYVQGSSRDTNAVVGEFSTRVYGWMTLGLLMTALVAFVVINSGWSRALAPYTLLLGFATLGIALLINFKIQTFSFTTLSTLFLVYAAFQGIFFGTAIPYYAAIAGASAIWSAFATGGTVFGIAMLYGMFTKSDLTTIGRILSFALVGLIGATLVYFVLSFFIKMTFFHLLISYLGLIIFTGLTAFDAQQIRRLAYQTSGQSTMAMKLSLVMALRMYINVIMIFWYLLSIFAGGGRR
ncbi:Bax inhibitor-1/YccA family protein [Simkania negevensis]|uniref:Bax inhibitor-1/YccA family protein n=1 Tax=Simkania negevensis TaxID=83561 RepID=A0ABS3ART1_9BACT|nr:Bax inhibitor-1/YccA family protein [Simkania negevensis]